MKKNILTILCICVFGVKVFSQNKFKLGLDAGYIYTTMHANLSDQIQSRYKGHYGFGINLSGEYRVWKMIFISTGVSYLQKNYEYLRTGKFEGMYVKYNNDFLSFPLLAGAYLINDPYENKGVWIKLAGGMFTEYWLRQKYQGEIPVFSQLQVDNTSPFAKISGTYDFNSNENNYARLGYGIHGQAQLGYSLKKINVYGSFNYQYGLSDNTKSDVDINKKNTTRSYMISVGVAYKFD